MISKNIKIVICLIYLVFLGIFWVQFNSTISIKIKAEISNISPFNNGIISPQKNSTAKSNLIKITRGMYGKWIKRKNQQQTCYFIVQQWRCCDDKIKQLHYVFQDDNLNRINPVEKLKIMLRNKNILLLGDSLMRGFSLGLQELLHMKEMESTAQIVRLEFADKSDETLGYWQCIRYVFH